MKILQINKFYYDKGGAERYLFLLSDLLQGKGHEVIPFSCAYEESKPSPYSSFFVSPITTGRVAFGWEGIKTAGRFLWSREAAHKLDALLTKYPVDVAHLHNIYHQISPSILSVLRKHRVPAVMTLHDFHLVSPAYNLTAHGGRCDHARGGKWHRAVMHRCVKESYAASLLCAAELALHRYRKVYEHGIKLFIAPSVFMRDTIDAWGFHGSAITVIPNFVETKNFPKAHGGNTMVFSGRLSVEKGIYEFFEVAKRCPEIPFEIAGAGPLAGFVENRAREMPNISYRGFIPPGQMPDFLARAGAVLIPSRAPEVFPMAALEAQAAGKAVVAFHSGGIPEIVIPGENGMLVPEGDIGAMARAVREIMIDRIQREKMGAQARLRAMTHFSPESHYRTIMEAYQKAKGG